MKFIERAVKTNILKKLKPGKVVVLVGARRTGKTVLLKEITKNFTEPILMLNGEDYRTAELFRNKGIVEYKKLLGNKRFLIIDEAQKVEGIGRILKLMVDEIGDLKILVTGSSAFDLNNTLGEPLTGRKHTVKLYPVAQCEWENYENLIETRSMLEHRMIYGNYPELIHLQDNSEIAEHLYELVGSYLLKDILELDNIKNSAKLLNILRLLAFQIGHTVSINEIAQNAGLSKNTVDHYLDLLEKVFIIFRLEGYSRNPRKEISKSPRYYFFDNGIRNALIANFNSLNLRNDQGALWENYIISERIKFHSYNNIYANYFFWRTYNQQEIDWIEERGGQLFAYEMKYNKNKIKVPSAWSKHYPDSEFQVIHLDNYLDFITSQHFNE
jgi:hypothetical protein